MSMVRISDGFLPDAADAGRRVIIRLSAVVVDDFDFLRLLKDDLLPPISPGER